MSMVATKFRHPESRGRCRRSVRAVLVGMLGHLFCGPAVHAQTLERFEFEHGAMGTKFHIVLYAPNAVLADRAAIFVDGRYTLQVQKQSDGETFDFRHVKATL